MAQVVVIPKMGLTMTRGEITNWLKQEGDPIKAGEPLFEVMTDKINSEIEAPADGYLLKILIPAGSEADVLTPACMIGAINEKLQPDIQITNQVNPTATESSDTSQAVPEAGLNPGEPGVNQTIGRISPLAKKMAAENGINIASLKGTGPEGRIVKEDVLAAIAAKNQSRSEQPVRGKVPLTGVRKIIAERLTQSKRDIPHVYFKMSVAVGNLKNLREEVNSYAAFANNKKISYNDFFIKSVAAALEEFPDVNVSLVNQEIVYHPEINIGMAVSGPNGLFVPVIKNANHKSVMEIHRQSLELVEKVKTNQLNADEVSGGTFTVSNLGMYQVDEFSAIINPPESAILAVGSIVDTPLAENGGIFIKSMLTLTLSVDHRVIDGVLASQFLTRIKQLLENPGFMRDI